MPDDPIIRWENEGGSVLPGSCPRGRRRRERRDANLISAVKSSANSVAALAYRSHHIGLLVKGAPRQLVRDGAILEPAMRRSGISRHDLEEALREHGMSDLDEASAAWIERSGTISVVPRRRAD